MVTNKIIYLNEVARDVAQDESVIDYPSEEILEEYIKRVKNTYQIYSQRGLSVEEYEFYEEQFKKDLFFLLKVIDLDIPHLNHLVENLGNKHGLEKILKRLS